MQAAKKVRTGVLSSQQGRGEQSQQPLHPGAEKQATAGYAEQEEIKRQTWVSLASSYVPLPAERGSQRIRKLIFHAGNLRAAL